MPELNAEYVTKMEDVLDVLARDYNAVEPVVVLDERPVQLRDAARRGRAMSPGKLARPDYEYVRRGTANIFCITEPKSGKHLTHATKNRKAPRFAYAMKRIARAYPKAKTIHIVMDNLNIHGPKPLLDTFGPIHGANLWARFTPHYTPKHGSWLNPAEIEASLWSRECLGRDRIGTLAELQTRTRAWNANANRNRRKITWRFTTKKARHLFRYKRSTKPRSRH